MYACISSVGLNALDVGLKLLHVVIVCCITPTEERVKTFFVLNCGPTSLYMCFHATDDAYSELQGFNDFLCVIYIIPPFCSFNFFLEGRLTLVCEQ